MEEQQRIPSLLADSSRTVMLAAECNTCETKPESCLLHRATYLEWPADGPAGRSVARHNTEVQLEHVHRPQSRVLVP